MPFWARAVTVLVAAVCEEVLFRGYAVTRVRGLTGSPVLAFLIPAAAFTALHLPGWGPAHLLFVAPGAALLTLWFQWRRDLWGNILAHFLVDAIPFLIAPLFLPA
nr:CPBP family intramembrane glutamic endopeptidase [Caulobacter sp. 17J80-11]